MPASETKSRWSAERAPSSAASSAPPVQPARRRGCAASGRGRARPRRMRRLSSTVNTPCSQKTSQKTREAAARDLRDHLLDEQARRSAARSPRCSTGTSCAPRNVGTSGDRMAARPRRGSPPASAARPPSPGRSRSSPRPWSCPAAASRRAAAAEPGRQLLDRRRAAWPRRCARCRRPRPRSRGSWRPARRWRISSSRSPANARCVCASTKPGSTAAPPASRTARAGARRGQPRVRVRVVTDPTAPVARGQRRVLDAAPGRPCAAPRAGRGARQRGQPPDVAHDEVGRDHRGVREAARARSRGVGARRRAATLSRPVAPRTSATADGGTPRTRRQEPRQRRRSPRPSTGGAVSRTTSAPSRSPAERVARTRGAARAPRRVTPPSVLGQLGQDAADGAYWRLLAPLQEPEVVLDLDLLLQVEELGEAGDEGADVGAQRRCAARAGRGCRAPPRGRGSGPARSGGRPASPPP